MRLTILYRDNSDHGRSVLTFVEMLRRRYPDKKPHLEDLDTREGAAAASLYGIVRYPALVVTSFDGRIVQHWEGEPLPTIDEVASHMVGQQAFSL